MSLNQYQITGPLAAAGMGEVFRARAFAPEEVMLW